MQWFDLVRPSGGLYYHGRALLNGNRWQPFREQIREWLATWPCNQKQDLILIGPSAGYSLPSEWLREFPALHAFDLDPLAAPLFRLRHKHPSLQFHRANLFWQDGRLSLAPLKEILRKYPRANILFCNVIGQILLEHQASEEDWLSFLRQLRLALKGRSWASYHDVLSIEHGQGTDHLTGGDWAEGLKVHQMEWRLSKNRTHHVHGVWEI